MQKNNLSFFLQLYCFYQIVYIALYLYGYLNDKNINYGERNCWRKFQVLQSEWGP